MAEEYNVQAIMNALKNEEEMDPDQHDGCYELIRETIKAYSKLQNFSVLDYKDLNLVYLTTVGTWKQGVEGKKKNVEESHLHTDDKDHLKLLWDEVWDKAGQRQYSNYELDASGNRSIGLFGTGFFSFQNKTTSDHVQAFICMCVDILPMSEDEEIFNRAEPILNKSFQGMQAGAASMVLHCLKPYTFPVLNSNMGRGNVFEVLGVKLNKPGRIETYIDNCRKIKAFRDVNFTFKNYRIFDITTWKIDQYALQHKYGTYGPWEIVSEDSAILTIDKTYRKDTGVEIPSDVRWFFRVSDLRAGDKYEAVLSYDGFEYDSYILRESISPARSRLFWDSGLAEELMTLTDGGQINVEFIRTGDNSYEIKKAESASGRVWLITWNNKNWTWDNFVKKCVETKAGKTFIESWACANLKPQIGDEVFLIKLGELPRGIIGHGKVYRTIYEKPHYDSAKAAEGKIEKAIDVEFDRLINYDQEKFISQEELTAKCSTQHWSPQSSGIEIKPEVLSTLKRLWKVVTEADTSDGYWPSEEEYPVKLSKEDWKRFIQEVENPSHKGCMRVLACFVDIGGAASPTTLSEKYKGHPTVYTGSVLNTSKRALNYFGMEPCPDGDTQRYFPIAFQGHVGKDANPGTYEYKMRPELLEALQEMDLTGIDLVYGKGGEEVLSRTAFGHNLILYGPPGTGKTYNSVIYAVAICEGRSLVDLRKENYSDILSRYNTLRNEGRILFTTFHQSYGYEEFVEGIRPVMTDDENIGNLEYEIRDGIFKKLCNAARTPEGTVINHNASIWFVRLKDSGDNDLKKECFDKGEIRYEGPENPEEGFAWEYERLSKMEPGDFVLSYGGKSVLVDGIGIVADGDLIYDVSKASYRWTRKVEWLLRDVSIDVKEINSNRYLPNFKIANMSHMKLSDLVRMVETNGGQGFRENVKPYVLIIDEINRGNISKIFGELITLIEETKRDRATETMEAVLPYSGETFSVPDNVYILGTMNTADRSIALMDTALRRRFEFVEMMPNAEVLDSLGIGTIAVGEEELNVARMLDVINKRIEFLFDREHTIGHAFFTKLTEDPSIETLAAIFEKNVIPLLQEYFYEDYEKIQLVLGDNSKPDEYKFILDRTIKVKDIFNGNPDVDLPEKSYQMQHDAFLKLESYKQIGRDL